MLVGKFANKTFEVSPKKILTFKDFSVSSELETDSGEASKKKQTTTIKGLGLLKISMEIQLQATLGVDVRSEIEDWFAMKDAAVAYPFILCGKAVSLNSFLITSCTQSDLEITPIASKPVITYASLKLEFTEYLPPGAQSSTKTTKISSTKSTKSTKKAKGISTESIQVANPYKVPTSVQKASAKRSNKGMT